MASVATKKSMRALLGLFVLAGLLASSVSRADQTNELDLENATVISSTDTLKAIEAKGYSIGDLLSRSGNTGVLDNSELAKSSTFKPVLANIKQELQAYKAAHAHAGVGLQFDERMFDGSYLESPRARFVLVGIVNRIDNGYKYQDRCGEIRFIYRLAYSVVSHGAPVSSRLPMTINLVFHAGAGVENGGDCSALAQSWLKTNRDTPPQDILTTGPLSAANFKRDNLKALEINLQIVRLAASARPDFGGHAEYLLKVYKWNGSALLESTLENQIDRDSLIANPALLAELKTWLLDPKNLKAIDAGTYQIPEKFLAKKAISVAPGGIDRSGNRLFFGLLTREDTDKLSFDGLENIKSAAGFTTRLNDSTCIGCHQTRAIGGFHFMGKDPLGKYPGNSVFLPGSAHFMGDLQRRHAVLEEIASKAPSVDFSRGFSARPQPRRSKDLVNTGLVNGWGGHCSRGTDPSFKSWTCADGLVCKTLLDTKDGLGMGVCMSPDQQVGGPCESGVIKTTAFAVDRYVQTSDDLRHPSVPNSMCSPQSQAPGTKTGGFLNGNIRTLSCDNLPAEASCGPLPSARPGFNACIGQKNFIACLKEFSLGVGLRGCDQKNPCRDDYICSESFEAKRGSCVPPYFLFQFRVDGHPKGDAS